MAVNSHLHCSMLNCSLRIHRKFTSWPRLLVTGKYFELCQLRVVLQSLTSEAATSLVHAFISCRLDYCNALLYGIADCQLQRLQCMQNAAARLVTGLRRTDHITPILKSLHWLPIRQRVTYTSWQLWCTNALMVALRSTWQSSVIQASTDVQE